MSAGRICSRTVVTATLDEPVQVVARRMAEFDVGTLVIVKGEGAQEPIGIVTDRDIAIRCVGAGRDPHMTPVSKIMTQPLRTIDEDMPIEHAILRMAEAKTRRLVVTGERKQLVGILSLDDVLNLLVDEMGPIRRLLEHQAPHVV
jgi:CBS domain-containing protein